MLDHFKSDLKIVSPDGTVRSIHVGFPSHGSGEYDRQARADITREIEVLLAEQDHVNSTR